MREMEPVPPVAEQLAALRADEVLLRGSFQPAPEPSELLRAARESNQMDAELELLRSTDNSATLTTQ